MIRIDDEGTWPSEALGLLEDSLQELIEYEADRARIDMQCREDVLMRLNTPAPANSEKRGSIRAALSEILSRRRIVGYHCTRLTTAEIASIKRSGLRPLDCQLVHSKIAEAVDGGELLDSVGQQLRSKNALNGLAGDRIGMIWFCYTRELLGDEGAVVRLLRSWGGEALYYYYENDEAIGPILRNVGLPAIVEAVMPCSRIETFMPLGSRFLNAFLARREVFTEHGPAVDGYVRTPILGGDILRVMTIEDPEFRRLTGCERWSESLQ